MSLEFNYPHGVFVNEERPHPDWVIADCGRGAKPRVFYPHLFHHNGALWRPVGWSRKGLGWRANGRLTATLLLDNPRVEVPDAYIPTPEGVRDFFRAMVACYA